MTRSRPELNPTEPVWRITCRQVTHNRHFASLSGLAMVLASCFPRWDAPREVVRVLSAEFETLYIDHVEGAMEA